MSRQYAKEHSLDIPHFSCIEFPLKVNNVDKAFDLVGGKDAIIRSVQDEVSDPLELRFTKSTYEHPINAKSNRNEQILLKISVPKKELEKHNGNIQKTLKALHEDQSAPVHIQPISIINRTFRFREMADFQYQTKNSEYAGVIDRSIHAMNYPNIKDLEFNDDLTPWEPESKTLNGEPYFDLPPPPRFSSIPLPFNYNYKKNAGAIMKEGKLTTRNKHIKLNSIIIKWNEPTPQEPSANLKQQLEIFEAEKETNLFYSDILKTLVIIRSLFEVRPFWIRKHIEANLPANLKPSLKFALPQVAYTFTKGPWRQTYIKFKVDPRSSSQYGRYQTEGFRVPSFNSSIPKDFMSEVPNGISKIFKFNGEELPSSLLFQLEDLTDPVIVELLSKAQIREVVDFHDGWYDSLTMLRLRRIMRYKLRMLVEGSRIDEARVDYLVHKLQLTESEADAKDEDIEVEDNDHRDEDEQEQEEEEDDYELDLRDANYDDILKYLEKFNPKGAEELRSLTNVIKQDDTGL